MRLLLESIVAVALLLGGVPAVHAQAADPDRVAPSDERARAHFEAGKSLYDAGRFAEAAQEWERAFELSGKPALLRNMYVAHRDAGNVPAAIDALRRFLATPDIDPGLRLNLEARLRRLQASQQATAEPAPDRAAPKSPATPSAKPPAEQSAPAAATAPSDDGESNLLAWGLVGAGGAMVVGGVVTGLLASAQLDDIETACPDDVCPAAYDLDGEQQRARTLALVTDVLWIGGAIAAGVGVTLLVLDDGPPESPPAAAVRCGPLGCTLRGRF